MRTMLPCGEDGISRSTVCDASWYGFPFEIRTTPPAGKWDEHCLPFHCLALHLEGRVSVQLGTKQRETQLKLTPGVFCVWPPGRHWDALEFRGTSKTVNVFCDWRLLRKSRLLEADELPELENILTCRSDPIVTSIVFSMLREHEQASPSGRLYAESLSLALAARLTGIAQEVERYQGDGLGQKRATLVADFIETYLGEDISVADLARLANLSPSRFATLFRASFSLPVHRYVLNRRIERSMSLLNMDSLRHVDIAAACGFASESHFNDVFKRITGMTPGNYRRTGTNFPIDRI